MNTTLKRKLQKMYVFVIILTFIPTISFQAQQENTIFYDDFDSYSSGSFPSGGGWILWKSGKGSSYQIVSTAYSYSGSRSLRLWGSSQNFARVFKRFNSDAPLIGYEAQVLIERVSWGTVSYSPHFLNEKEEMICGGINFYHTGFKYHDDMTISLMLSSDVVGEWQPEKWYHLKVIIDREEKKFDAWIDGSYVGEGITGGYLYEITAILLSASYDDKIYFDDIRVFSISSDSNGDDTNGYTNDVIDILKMATGTVLGGAVSGITTGILGSALSSSAGLPSLGIALGGWWLPGAVGGVASALSAGILYQNGVDKGISAIVGTAVGSVFNILTTIALASITGVSLPLSIPVIAAIGVGVVASGIISYLTVQ